MVNNTETYLVESALALPASPFSRSCPGRRNRRLCGLCVVRLPLRVGIADANAVVRAGDGDASEQGMGQQQRAAKEQKPLLHAATARRHHNSETSLEAASQLLGMLRDRGVTRHHHFSIAASST